MSANREKQEDSVWLRAGGLVYRLKHGFNCDEINVAMVDGSRDDLVREQRAEWLRAALAQAGRQEPVNLLQAIHDEIGSELFEMQSAGTWLRVADAVRIVGATPPAAHSEHARHMVAGAADGALTDRQIRDIAARFQSHPSDDDGFVSFYSTNLERFARALLAAQPAADAREVVGVADDVADGVAGHVMAELEDRKGVLDDVDAEMKQEIRTAIAEIVQRGYGGPLRAVRPSADMADAYVGAREDLAIWKKRALEAEDLNRKFMREINGPTHMGEPVIAAEPARADRQGVALSRYTPGIAEDKVRGGQIAVMYQRADGDYVKLSDARASSSRAEVEPVAWQYRWCDKTNTPENGGGWQEWKQCDQAKFEEINGYIRMGYAYETRELLAATEAPNAEKGE
ncbi:hypothetical protein [Cupriavidus alkaliphilus]|uniref:Uncharacterized protein n=1 Tax=Cupriavidus alkaliphilus TaxID=942866 RepID=A0A7W4YTG6_9BURK|nr:hypothetical protein [Cupriavidus alkaliphilus]MBB3010693.1 hypothetical protein [Cupriavidus alkaliphilus]